MNSQWYDQMTIAERRAAGFWRCVECPWPTQEQIDAAYEELSNTDKPIITWPEQIQRAEELGNKALEQYEHQA